MDYGEVLGTAWKIIRKHKNFILLGLMAGCTGTIGQSRGNDFSEIFDLLSYYLDEEKILFFIILFLALLFVMFVITIYGSTALVRGSWQADEGVAHLLLSDLLNGSRSYFWRIFTVTLLMRIVTSLIFGFIGLQSLPDDASIGYLLCAIPLICLSIPLLFFLSILANLATVAVIGEDLGLAAGIKRAYHLILGHKGPVMLMGLIIFGVELILLVIFFVISIVFAVLLGYSFSDNSSMICIFIPVVLVIVGFLEAYVRITWTLTFRRLALKPAEEAMVVEVPIS